MDLEEAAMDIINSNELFDEIQEAIEFVADWSVSATQVFDAQQKL